MDTFRRIFVSRDLSFCLETFITENSSDKLNWMSGSLVSASNGKGGNLGFLGFYISDIILRGGIRFPQSAGGRPTIRTAFQGGKKPFRFFLQMTTYMAKYIYISVGEEGTCKHFT